MESEENSSDVRELALKCNKAKGQDSSMPNSNYLEKVPYDA